MSTPIFAKSLFYDLVICAVFHNESLFLKEWIEFHKLIGVQHFYLYNHMSTDNSAEILQPYILAGEVDLFDFPQKVETQKEYLELLQIPVYTHALDLAKKTAKWAAFIDLDEFVFPVKETNLVSFLRQYELFGGLAVNWQIYGTSGIDHLPKNGLITESLIWKGAEDTDIHRVVKLVVQPKLVKQIANPHSFIFHDGFYAVDSKKRPISEGIEAEFICIDDVRINHYWFGTLSWFLTEKIPRREKWGIYLHGEQLKLTIDSFNSVFDEAIHKYIPQLRKNMLPQE